MIKDYSNNNINNNLKFFYLKSFIYNRLENLFNSIKSKIRVINYSAFSILKNNKNKPKKISAISSNEIYTWSKKQLVMIKIINTLKSLFMMYKKNKDRILLKFYSRWKFSNLIENKFCKLKLELQNNLVNKYKIKKRDLEVNLKNSENEINSIQSKLTELKESINSKSLKNYEERQDNLKKKLTTLEQEKKKLEQDLKMFTTDTKDKENKQVELESMCKEMEQTVNNLNDSLKEKEFHLNLHIEEMNEILEFFEKQSSKKN